MSFSCLTPFAVSLLLYGEWQTWKTMGKKPTFTCAWRMSVLSMSVTSVYQVALSITAFFCGNWEDLQSKQMGEGLDKSPCLVTQRQQCVWQLWNICAQAARTIKVPCKVSGMRVKVRKSYLSLYLLSTYPTVGGDKRFLSKTVSCDTSMCHNTSMMLYKASTFSYTLIISSNRTNCFWDSGPFMSSQSLNTTKSNVQELSPRGRPVTIQIHIYFEMTLVPHLFYHHKLSCHPVTNKVKDFWFQTCLTLFSTEWAWRTNQLLGPTENCCSCVDPLLVNFYCPYPNVMFFSPVNVNFWLNNSLCIHTPYPRVTLVRCGVPLSEKHWNISVRHTQISLSHD